MFFLPEPVQVQEKKGVLSDGWRTLIAACREIKPVMVVLDTQARITVGMDENDNGQMGVLTEAVRLLKEATGACVLVVHHIGRNGENARGASAIDGAQDTEVRIERPKPKELRAVMSLDKQKDGDEAVEWKLDLTVVEVGLNPHTGRQDTSLAVRPFDPFQDTDGPVEPPEWVSRLAESQREVVDALSDHADDSGATTATISQWITERRAAVGADKSARMPKTSLATAIARLVKSGHVTRLGAGRVALTEHLE